MAIYDDRRSRRITPNSSFQAGRDAGLTARNFQAGFDSASGASVKPKINAGGRVSAEDWMGMSPAMRQKYASQAPSSKDFDFARGLGRIPQTEVTSGGTTPNPVQTPVHDQPSNIDPGFDRSGTDPLAPSANPSTSGTAGATRAFRGGNPVFEQTMNDFKSGMDRIRSGEWQPDMAANRTPARPAGGSPGSIALTGRDGASRVLPADAPGTIRYTDRRGKEGMVGANQKQQPAVTPTQSFTVRAPERSGIPLEAPARKPRGSARAYGDAYSEEQASMRFDVPEAPPNIDGQPVRALGRVY